MINLAEIAIAPEFSQSYKIHRKTGEFVAGRFEQTETNINAFGVVTTATPKEIQQLPEGDRITGTKVFYSTCPIYTTRSDSKKGTSDEIEHNGKRYRVSQVFDYSGQGFYKAFAVDMAGV